VTPSRMLRRVQAEDGRVDATAYIGPFYSRIIIFYILDHTGIIFFSLLLGHINMTLEECDSLSFLLFSFGFFRVECDMNKF
jgi:hypothetical protein